MKVLLLDIGNLSLRLSVYEDRKNIAEFKVYSDKLKSVGEYQEQFEQFLNYHEIQASSLDGALLCSVVPSLTKRIKNAVENLLKKPCLIVSKSLKTGLAIRMDNPAELGSDLLSEAVGAISDYKEDVMIADLSSCASFFVVSPKKGYIGGALFPGLTSSSTGLISSSAQLMDIEFETPARLVGKSTRECLNSGIVIGYADLVRDFHQRMEKETGVKLQGVLTGDDASILAPLLKDEFIVNKDLVFDGLYEIYLKNNKIPSDHQ